MKKSKTTLTFASLLLAGSTFGFAGCDLDTPQTVYGPPPDLGFSSANDNDDIQELYGPPSDDSYDVDEIDELEEDPAPKEGDTSKDGSASENNDASNDGATPAKAPDDSSSSSDRSR